VKKIDVRLSERRTIGVGAEMNTRVLLLAGRYGVEAREKKPQADQVHNLGRTDDINVSAMLDGWMDECVEVEVEVDST
jgi:hypothetical protein